MHGGDLPGEIGCIADTHAAGTALVYRATTSGDPAGRAEARRLLHTRPATWETLTSTTPGKLHAIDVARALKPFVDADPDTILICDGGEYAQWAQSLIRCERRLVNGVAGAIGVSIPFAAAARAVDPHAPIFAVLGDGTFGRDSLAGVAREHGAGLDRDPDRLGCQYQPG